MKNRYLFPHSYRAYGWVLLFPFLVLGVSILYFDFSFSFLELKANRDNLFSGINLTDEIAALGLIVSLLLIGFSKEKIEDEQIAQLRLDSLQWSVYFNYMVLAAAIIFIHGMAFLDAMVYNMFTLLVFFIVRFRWAVNRENRLLN
jgi:hypothetical protein